jgi:hypothetical protein
MGASGATIVWQALGTLTSSMAFLFSRFRVDLGPRVATSLAEKLSLARRLRRHSQRWEAYQTVATPYLRDVRTVAKQVSAYICSLVKAETT